MGLHMGGGAYVGGRIAWWHLGACLHGARRAVVKRLLALRARLLVLVLVLSLVQQRAADVQHLRALQQPCARTQGAAAAGA